MYQLKQSPQDFIVKEVFNLELRQSGKYSICLLRKTNYSTIRALEHIAKSLNKQLKDIGFAGTKDKKAITEQLISIKNIKKEKIENLSLKDIQLTLSGYSNEPISLGRHKGNEFIITIRNIEKKDIEKIENKTRSKQLMPNYFGRQRFSKNNIEIGKNIITSRFKEAICLILSSNSDYKEKIETFLENNLNSYIPALKLVPKKLLLLYVHAYQSHLWNRTLKEYLILSKENTYIPIIGFGTEIENEEIRKIIEKIMKEENISFRDFINRKFPEMSSEGDLRQALVEIQSPKILEKTNNSIKIIFKLKKGSYATIAIAFLLECPDTVLKDFL
ncbi:MAG: tRNA pseudouridine(13) synthase TruD [Nanoarchaeota archaeon]|nr:tRNA pseudouridine(13) synthase TruD [Nanoarchaeota archaeon]